MAGQTTVRTPVAPFWRQSDSGLPEHPDYWARLQKSPLEAAAPLQLWDFQKFAFLTDTVQIDTKAYVFVPWNVVSYKEQL